jgi:hypothetical protein
MYGVAVYSEDAGAAELEAACSTDPRGVKNATRRAVAVAGSIQDFFIAPLVAGPSTV